MSSLQIQTDQQKHTYTHITHSFVMCDVDDFEYKTYTKLKVISALVGINVQILYHTVHNLDSFTHTHTRIHSLHAEKLPHNLVKIVAKTV